MGPDDPRHGTPNGYTNLRCRCRECRLAHAAAVAGARQRRHDRMLAGEAHPEHGKSSTYGNWACRCPLCREAHAKAMAKRTQRLPD